MENILFSVHVLVIMPASQYLMFICFRSVCFTIFSPPPKSSLLSSSTLSSLHRQPLPDPFMFYGCISDYLFLLASVTVPLVVEAITAIKVVVDDEIRVFDVRTGRSSNRSFRSSYLQSINAAVVVVVLFGVTNGRVLWQGYGRGAASIKSRLMKFKDKSLASSSPALYKPGWRLLLMLPKDWATRLLLTSMHGTVIHVHDSESLFLQGVCMVLHGLIGNKHLSIQIFGAWFRAWPTPLDWERTSHVMANSTEKIRLARNQNVLVCERGTMFGYNDLIVDPHSFEWLREASCHVGAQQRNLLLRWIMAIIMALLSGFAGVYTELSEIQWAAFILLCAGCTTAQLNPSAIIKKRPSRNINVHNFWLCVFGMPFNVVAIIIQDFDVVVNKGFFHGYSPITVLMIINHALSGIVVSMVMKYVENIVKVNVTHALQQPAGKKLEGGGVGSGGLQELIPCVARTAVVVGVDGLLMEVHNDPLNAPVDGPIQWVNCMTLKYSFALLI
ncbi:hypothetical protein Lser_V15G17417 [Lactuca serriola]